MAEDEAWEAGWEACANYLQDAECDPAHWDLFHVNPYLADAEPTSCPCSCHKPSTARPPHPSTQIGKGAR